jgi:nitrous oxidase accessory protein
MKRDGDKTPDKVAVWTLVAVAALALAASWWLPWWTMEARAPQYGQRVLVVQVNPTGVQGDTFEMDALGHYVGIRPLGDLAQFERKAAPVGLALACAGLLTAPWLRRRWLRALAVLPVIVMPAVFIADLGYWMRVATNRRDESAALNLTVKEIDTKVIGKYAVGQFSVNAILSAGLFGATTAGLLSIGLIFSAPLPLPFRRRRKSGAAVAVGAGLALCLGAPSAHASIAEAIDAAREGDTVSVPAGVHREHLVIAKRITLRGEPGAIIDGEDRGTVVRIEAPGVELRDLTIRRSGDNYNAEDSGVRLQRAASTRVSNLRIEDTMFGVFVVQADDCVIERSTVIGKDVPDVRRGDAIRLWYSSRCRILGNRVDRSRDVVIWYSSGTQVEDNLVRRGRYGLHYMYSDHNRFRGNVFEDNQVGAAIMNSRDIELIHNSFSFSNGPSAYGLLLKDADDVRISDNRFVGNSIGLFFDGAPQSRGARVDVRANLVARNDTAVALDPRSRGVRFWENSFIGNRSEVQLRGSGATDGAEWAVGGRGNYWSDAVIYDRDGDGVSDVPYRVDSTYEVLADRHPQLAFFAGTPAADAIDLGARLFPIFAPRPKLNDPAPLARPALTDWLVGERPRRGALTLAGLCLLGAAAGAFRLSRKVLS